MAANRPIRRSTAARPACAAHLGHDPRDQRVARGSAGLDLERALAVDRSRVDQIARPAFHRHRFPGDRLLVHAGATLDHMAIDRDRVAGTHQNVVAGPNLGGGNPLDRPIGTDPFRGLGRDLQQPADRPASALQAQRLERLGQAEEERHGRRLVPLPQPDRPQDGQAHEHVDVEPERPQAAQSPGKQPGSSAANRQREADLGQPLERACLEPEPKPGTQPGGCQARSECQTRADGRCPASMPRPPGNRRGTRCFGQARQVGLHPGALPDAPEQARVVDQATVVIHGHQAVNQIESQPRHTRRPFECGAKRLDFVGAVKPPHLQRAPRLAHHLGLVRVRRPSLRAPAGATLTCCVNSAGRRGDPGTFQFWEL